MSLSIDFETASTVDPRKKGLYNYARDPSTFIWCMGYAFDDEPADIWYGNQPFPARVADYVAEHRLVIAFNMPFELAIWNNVLTRLHPNIPALTPEQSECAMARCYAMSLPGALVDAAPALGLDVAKDAEGHQLMLRMCKPAKWQDGKPVYVPQLDKFTFLGEKRTGAWALKRLGEYCRQDVEVEREVSRRTARLSAFERRVWQVDYRINQRGALFDPEAVKAAIKIKDDVVESLNSQMAVLTEGAVEKCSSLPALKDWLGDYGLFVDSLNKQALQELLEADVPGPVRQALELRQKAGRATSVAKLATINELAGPDGRVRNLFHYHGAGTGRWAGRGVQPHNFPRDLPPGEQVRLLMKHIINDRPDVLEALYDDPLTIISQLLRAFLIAEPGSYLIGGDWSGIEGRGIAWLAGEEWKLDVFRECDADPAKPDTYMQAYAKSFGISPYEVTSDQRQIGKVEELAFGYQGGVGAFHQMAGMFGVEKTNAEADLLKEAWREAHPAIKRYWKALQAAALSATRNPGRITKAGASAREVRFKKSGSFLWLLLPSGRTLCYPYPEIRHDDYGPFLTYRTRPSAEDFKRGRIVPDPSNSRKFARVATYGGKLAENATQAVCRDFLAHTLVECENRGLPAVWHVHDEPVAEVRAATEEHRAEFQRILTTPPVWASDFPLAADCWLSDRYEK